MTYQEILDKYEIIAVRPPKRGELFAARPNCSNGQDWEVAKASKTGKRVYVPILQLKST